MSPPRVDEIGDPAVARGESKSRGELDHRERGYALGVQAVVTKPFERSEPLERVRRVHRER
jgi:DNA-binding response OmpR family regulator